MAEMDEFDLLLRQIVDEQKQQETSTILEQQRKSREYELERAWKKIEEVQKGSLRDRKEARAKWKECLIEHPEIVAERVRWLLMGSYGEGSYMLAIRALEDAKKPAAKIARLAWLIATFEWMCPGTFCTQAYKELTKTQQKKANDLIWREIVKWEEERKEEEEERKNG